MKWLRSFWKHLVDFVFLLGTVRISLIMTLVFAYLQLGVDQVRDAVIALANFGALHHFIIIAVFGVFWSLLVWYWARIFFYMEYLDQELQGWKLGVVTWLPRVLGVGNLAILAVSFIREGWLIKGSWPQSTSALVILGVVFAVLGLLLGLFVSFRRRIFGITSGILYKNSDQPGQFLPFKDLPEASKNILRTITIISLVLLTAFLISPLFVTGIMGDGDTVVLASLCIWISLLYWVDYGVARIRFPFFMLLLLLVVLFSFINSNKNVRLIAGNPGARIDVVAGFQEWYAARTEAAPMQETALADTGKTAALAAKVEGIPLVLVLAEGGGIRAAYWSAGVLARLETLHPDFSRHIFGIFGVSGGSFGAVVHAHTLGLYQSLTDEERKSMSMEAFAADVIGKDYLSPVMASMFTREPVHLVLPWPIEDFDYAKDFERSWEYQWKQAVNRNFPDLQKRDNTEGTGIGLDQPFLSLWQGRAKNLPALFLGVTQVDNGVPCLVSSLSFPVELGKFRSTAMQIGEYASPGSALGIIRDVYDWTDGKDLRASSAALLSARFPYVGPAGMLKSKDRQLGFVDGGYFDNTGADAALHVLELIEANARDLKTPIRPVVLYLKNGNDSLEPGKTGNPFFYQLTAPIRTIFNVRSSQTFNALSRLIEHVQGPARPGMVRGQFVTVELDSSTLPEGLDIPLGWALSRTVQEEMDRQIRNLDKKLPGFSGIP